MAWFGTSMSGLARRLLAALLLSTPFAQTAAADPALWVVRSEGATVYLFGTVHILPQGMEWKNPAISKALDESSEIWTEADISKLSSTVAAIKRYGLEKGPPVTEQLPPEYRVRYERQMRESGLPPLLFAHVRPWLAELLLTAGAMQHAKLAIAPGVEPALMEFAKLHNKATPNFETAEQQFAIMADIPQDAQLASLEQQIDEFDQADDTFNRLATAWHAGDVATLDRLVNHEMRAHSPRAWTDLIERRNEQFADKIADRLQGSGTVFVAVGAGHLCGSDSVQAHLTTSGFTVERLQ